MKKLEYLVTGTGRCGTVYMARLLSSLGVMCGHESVFNYEGLSNAIKILSGKCSPDPSYCSIFDKLNKKSIEHWFDEDAAVADSSYLAAPFILHEILASTKIIHVVRHPLQVISSFGKDTNFFADADKKTIWQRFVFNYLPSLEDIDNVIERVCYYYIHWNRMIEKSYQNHIYLRHKVENKADNNLISFLEAEGAKKWFKDDTINSWKKRDSNFNLADIPSGSIKDDFIKISNEYGYSICDEHVSVTVPSNDYEIEFVVPVTTSEPKYLQRLKSFREIGLLNTKNRKIKLVLLIKTNSFPPELLEDWPSEVTVVVKEFPQEFHAYKLCDYYLNMNNFDSKWYVAVDDDSVTNVNGLWEAFADYDPDEEIYLSTSHLTQVSKDIELELDILRDLNALHLLKNDLTHDWESHYVSRGGLKKILANNICRQYISRRQLIFTGFGDQFLPYAAKIAGIQPITAQFSSPYPLIEKFSIFDKGSSLHHIHYICQDQDNTNLFKLWKRSLNIPKEALYYKIVNKEFLFAREQIGSSFNWGDYRNIIGVIKLSSSNTINIYQNPNEFYWMVENNKLHFLNKHGKETTILTPQNEEGNHLVGSHLPKPQVNHHLRKLY